MNMPPLNDDWRSEINDLAKEKLSVHTHYSELFEHIEQWYTHNAKQPVEAADSPIQQALICLSTEALMAMPQEVKNLFDFTKEENEEILINWLRQILNLGRSFEDSIQTGEFDNL